MGIGPCVLTKVLCGPFMGDSRWVIGWAMVGRAEFSYFIAIMAKSVKMMEEKVFAIIIWALVYATIFAPLVFRKVLARYLAKTQGKEVQEPASPNKRDLAHRMSGHLPDFEEEENRKAQRAHSKEREHMALSLQEKDEEIARLRDALTLATAATKDPEDGTSGELTTANGGSANDCSGDGTSGSTPEKDVIAV